MKHGLEIMRWPETNARMRQKISNENWTCSENRNQKRGQAVKRIHWKILICKCMKLGNQTERTYTYTNGLHFQSAFYLSVQLTVSFLSVYIKTQNIRRKITRAKVRFLVYNIVIYWFNRPNGFKNFSQSPKIQKLNKCQARKDFAQVLRRLGLS